MSDPPPPKRYFSENARITLDGNILSENYKIAVALCRRCGKKFVARTDTIAEYCNSCLEYLLASKPEFSNGDPLLQYDRMREELECWRNTARRLEEYGRMARPNNCTCDMCISGKDGEFRTYAFFNGSWKRIMAIVEPPAEQRALPEHVERARRQNVVE